METRVVTFQVEVRSRSFEQRTVAFALAIAAAGKRLNTELYNAGFSVVNEQLLAGPVTDLEEFKAEAQQAVRVWIAGGRRSTPWNEVERELGLDEKDRAQPATCSKCHQILIPPDPAKRQLISRKTVKLCPLHAQAEATAADLAKCYVDMVELAAEHRALVGALERIATTLREGEVLEGTYQEYCQRSPTAAFSALDSLIVIAREVAQEIAAARPQAAAKGGAG